MVPVEMLSPGMRVKIVDEWCFGCFPNAEGLMDKYLGQVVTILDIDGQYVRIEEGAGDCKFQEGGHWSWGAYSFDCIVEDEGQENFEVSSKDGILSFIFGN